MLFRCELPEQNKFHRHAVGEFFAQEMTESQHLIWHRAFRQEASLEQRQQAQIYPALCDQLNEVQGMAHPVYQLLGYPDQLQGDLAQECWEREWAYHQPHRTDWQLLLQLDTYEDADMRWGDEGLLYFYIPQQALAAGDFSQVHLLAQCY